MPVVSKPAARKTRKVSPKPSTSPRKALERRLTLFQALIDKLRPVPYEWLRDDTGGRTEDGESSNGQPGQHCVPCSDYKKLVTAWRKALKWTPGLDQGLSCMLAASASTMLTGDQLWFKLIAPPSTGKSTLCEAFSINKRYVLSKSTLRGFHTGMKGEDGEDISLISQLYGMTFIVKDGDTLLQSPNLGQILSEGRDIYDGVSRTSYRNGNGMDYTDHRMTWILAGTSSLREIDQSELGARFLDCVIMEEIEDDFEDEVLWRVANRVDNNLGLDTEEGGSILQDSELTKAMQLTGGYITYLRTNINDLIKKVRFPEESKRKVTRFAKFVANMRARPSKKQNEEVSREFAARLVSQHIRLAKCMAVVLNKDVVDLTVMQRVHKVAMDTSRGITMRLVQQLSLKPGGSDPRSLSIITKFTDDEIRKYLRFMEKLNIVERNRSPSRVGAKNKQNCYKLTPRFATLYEETLM